MIDAGHAEEALAALQLQSSQPTFVYRYQHARPDEGPRAISSCTGRVMYRSRGLTSRCSSRQGAIKPSHAKRPPSCHGTSELYV